MRAFKHISAQKEKELLEIFPSAWNFEWQDDELFTKVPFSLWDKWLCESSEETDSGLWNVDLNEKARREHLFCNLAEEIINEYETYGLFFRQNKFKSVRSRAQLISDIYGRRELNRPLFMPSLGAIYAQGYDYTGWLYLRNKEQGAPLVSLVKALGLKIIE